MAQGPLKKAKPSSGSGSGSGSKRYAPSPSLPSSSILLSYLTYLPTHQSISTPSPSQLTKPSPGTGPSGASQKGKGPLKPKKGVLLKQHKMNKVPSVSFLPSLFPWISAGLMNCDQKLSGGLTTKTEQSLAAKAGHLEMLAGGKKEKGKGGGASGGKGRRG